MKKDDFIKLGLDEDAAEKAAVAVAEALKGYVPKARFDEVNTAKKTAEALVAQRDQQLETLKAAGSVDDLKKQIEDLQAENKAREDAHAAELLQVRVDADVEAALTEARARNHRAVRSLLNLDKAEIGEDGRVKGLRDQLTVLAKAEDSRFLFDVSTTPVLKGARIGENGLEAGDGKADTATMNYDQLCAYLERNPEAKL